MVSKKLTKENIISALVSFVFVFVQSTLYVNKDYALNNISDEFGYISNAVFMAKGIKYTITGMWSAYYAYGYSFILAIFYRLTDNFIAVYRFAMVFNILCLIITYWLVNRCVCMLLEKQGVIVTTIVSIAIWGYTANVVLSKWMWAETVICMLYWLLCWSILRERNNNHSNICVHISRIVILLCLYSMHQRTLVVVIAYAIYLFYKALFVADMRKVNLKKILTAVGLLVFFAVCFIGLNKYKQYLVREIYTYSSSVDINNYSGIANSVSTHLTVHGILDYFVGLSGKVWYFCVGTCFLGPTVIFTLIKCFYLEFKIRIKRKKTLENMSADFGFELFVVMCLVGEILLTSIFMWGMVGRHDTMIYGRYMEFAFGPIILLFFNNLFLDADAVKSQLKKVFILALVLSPIVAYVWEYVSSTSYKSMFSSSIVFYFFWGIPMFAIPFIILGYRFVLYSSIMGLINKDKTNRVCIVLAIFVICVWTINADRYNANAYSYQEILSSRYKNIVAVLDDYNDSEVFLVCKEELETEEANSIFNARIIQSHLYDRNMIPTYSISDDSQPGVYIICNKILYDSDLLDYSDDDVVYSEGDWTIVFVDSSTPKSV